MKSTKMLREFRKDPVMYIAGAFAVISCFFTRPDMSYFAYIDYRTLALLFCLMIVSSGIEAAGLFQLVSNFFIQRIGNTRSLAVLPVLLCFFVSMFITNDVALIMFVPLSIVLMSKAAPKYLCYTIVLDTVAANLGSMLTPFGNPQNVYLYSYYELGLIDFFKAVWSYGAAGLILILLMSLLIPKDKLIPAESSLPETCHTPELQDARNNMNKSFIYGILFCVCVLCVLRIVPYLIGMAVVSAVVFITDRRMFLKVDYNLLLTFVFFFIFVGNIGRISEISELIKYIIRENTFAASAFLSQIISNVPAAILLSGFTKDGIALMLGVDVGGLGTMVASMASLISFKYYLHSEHADTVRYITVFSIVNFVILAVLIMIYILS